MIPGKTKYSTNKELVPGAAEAEVDGASIWTLHCTKNSRQEDPARLSTSHRFSTLLVRTPPYVLYVRLFVRLHPNLHLATATCLCVHLFLSLLSCYWPKTILIPPFFLLIFSQLTWWLLAAGRDSSGSHLHLHYLKIQLLNTAGLLSAI